MRIKKHNKVVKIILSFKYSTSFCSMASFKLRVATVPSILPTDVSKLEEISSS